jgi:hypothetical protein
MTTIDYAAGQQRPAGAVRKAAAVALSGVRAFAFGLEFLADNIAEARRLEREFHYRRYYP